MGMNPSPPKIEKTKSQTPSFKLDSNSILANINDKNN